MFDLQALKCQDVAVKSNILRVIWFDCIYVAEFKRSNSLDYGWTSVSYQLE